MIIYRGRGITVYNAQHESLTKAWADGFTKETGIKVTIRKGGDTELANQIVQEGAASPADVFVTENSPAMVLVEKAGLFETLQQGRAGAGAGEFPARRAGAGSALPRAAPSSPMTSAS
jgi:ABC-type Fe3+ transport system substrate-binding protein